MNAAELLWLSERLGLCDAYTAGDMEIIETCAEIIGLLAWAEQNKVEAVRRRHGYSVHLGLVAHNGDTLIDTLRRAREASKS